MNYVSVCAGIEAASVAWEPLGWKPLWFSEIERFPCKVLKHHYPNVPNLGDMNNFKEWPNEKIEVLIGGTPCQSFSFAGLRQGLDDPRGNLMLVYLAIVERYKPKWIIWENVPGVLSSNRGRDFGTFLATLGKIGYGFSYRVLNAQYFGVPQRRKRVYVVGYLGDWRPTAAVLFERGSLSGNFKKSKKKVQKITEGVAGSLGKRGTRSHTELDGHGAYIPEITHTLTRKYDASEDGSGKGVPIISMPSIELNYRVRRLTPLECDRLMGFPDNYTLIPYSKKNMSPEGVRYKSLGNSMAIPVIRWLGERIQLVDDILKEQNG